MKIAIFGLGYVGCVGLGCLAEQGHELVGIDIEASKVDLVNSGKATITEEGLDELIEGNVKNRRIKATADTVYAVKNSDVALICVGTPNNENGQLDMTYIYKVASEIGEGLREKDKFYTVAIRSTVIPGTNKRVGEIIAETSGKKFGVDFGVVSNPEFLREGSAVYDFYNPPYTVAASESGKGIDQIREVYAGIKAEMVVTDIGTAELIKFVSNSFHALKIAFANEIGRISKSLGIDSHVLMDLFVRDKHLNISHRYLKPGFAYGGSCLPKDLKALNLIAYDHYVKVPVISAIDESNKAQIDHALKLILGKKKKTIGFYGIAFKEGTDDMRNSGALEMAERLIGKGFAVKVYDKNVHLSKLMGKNRGYLYERVPHIAELVAGNLDEFLRDLEIIVVVHNDKKMKDILNKARRDIEVIDLVRVFATKNTWENYEGICW